MLRGNKHCLQVSEWCHRRRNDERVDVTFKPRQNSPNPNRTSVWHCTQILPPKEPSSTQTAGLGSLSRTSTTGRIILRLKPNSQAVSSSLEKPTSQGSVSLDGLSCHPHHKLRHTTTHPHSCSRPDATPTPVAKIR